MNAKNALKHLRSIGYDIIQIGDKYHWNRNTFVDILTSRQLIKMAKSYTSENNQTTSIKKKVKYYHRRKNRAKLREALNHENYDDIPLNDDLYIEDCWNWD